MTITGGELVRSLRKKLNLSQEKFAEEVSISTRQLSRIETGQADISILDILDMMEVFNMPMADLKMLYLESQELYWYRILSDAYKYRQNRDAAAFYETFSILEGSPLWDSPYVQQIHAFVKLREAELLKTLELESFNDPSRFNKDDVQRWQDTISITIKDFDYEKVSEYLLTRDEVYTISGLCDALSCVGAHEKAISLAQSLINNKSVKARFAMDSSDYLYAYAMFDLTHAYWMAGMYNEAFDMATKALRHCINENLLSSMCYINRQFAEASKMLGEEESLYMPYFMRAYHLAVLTQNTHEIITIRKKVKDICGISLVE